AAARAHRRRQRGAGGALLMARLDAPVVIRIDPPMFLTEVSLAEAAARLQVALDKDVMLICGYGQQRAARELQDRWKIVTHTGPDATLATRASWASEPPRGLVVSCPD